MAIETELKFTVPDRATLSRVAALTIIAGYPVADHGIRRHVDTAFDTPDCRLYHEKAVLRLREGGGNTILTFKAHQTSDGAYYQRIEVEAPVTISPEDITAGNLPDCPPITAFRERFGTPSLTARLTTRNDRRRLILGPPEAPRYELALDDVLFSGPRGTATACELEVEALTEDHSDLEAVGTWLSARFPLLPAGPSKYTLGMSLVGDVTG